MVYIWKKIPVLRLTKADLVATKQNIREHCRISFPMAFQASIIAIGTIMVKIALNQLGPTSVAAHTAAQRLTVSDSSNDVIRGNDGDVLRKTMVQRNMIVFWLGVRERIKLSLTFAIVVGIILNLFSPILIRAFVGEGHEDVVELGTTILPYKRNNL